MSEKDYHEIVDNNKKLRDNDYPEIPDDNKFQLSSSGGLPLYNAVTYKIPKGYEITNNSSFSANLTNEYGDTIGIIQEFGSAEFILKNVFKDGSFSEIEELVHNTSMNGIEGKSAIQPGTGGFFIYNSGEDFYTIIIYDGTGDFEKDII